MFEFNDKTVSEVMIHRTEVYAIDVTSNIEDILGELKEYKYSRIPIYEGNIEQYSRSFVSKRLTCICIHKKRSKNQKTYETGIFAYQRVNQ